MAVEMDAGARAVALDAGDDIAARIAVAVGDGAFGTNIGDIEPARRQAGADELRTGRVCLAGRVDGGEANKLLRQGDQLIALGVDALPDMSVHSCPLSTAGESLNSDIWQVNLHAVLGSVRFSRWSCHMIGRRWPWRPLSLLAVFCQKQIERAVIKVGLASGHQLGKTRAGEFGCGKLHVQRCGEVRACDRSL